jgi:mono/diheme cytochrome c family protein
MSRRLILVPVLAAAVAAGGCGSEEIALSKDDPDYRGAVAFTQHCGACHTFDVAGTQGSATEVASREYKDGPNFNQRKEGEDDVLYAIENGGFSSGPMPQNIVTGGRARAVAQFVAKYSGRKAARPPTPQQQAGGG